MSRSLNLRIAHPSDSEQIINLIDSVYQEYDDAVCLDGAEADLVDLNAYYFDNGGAFWVLEQNHEQTDVLEIVGTHAAKRDSDNSDVCVFRRLYLANDLRGTQWGQRLMQITIDWAKEQGFKRVEFWSDTRFSRAHRFFEKFGFFRKINFGLAPPQLIRRVAQDRNPDRNFRRSPFFGKIRNFPNHRGQVFQRHYILESITTSKPII